LNHLLDEQTGVDNGGTSQNSLFEASSNQNVWFLFCAPCAELVFVHHSRKAMDDLSQSNHLIIFIF
jgi:hypothetical protein